MCCFSRSVRHVSGTQIFARGGSDGGQFLVYKMTVALTDDVAMVLPLPVPLGTPEAAVRFIDLSGYPDFFVDLDSAFPSYILPSKGRSLRGGDEPPRAKLVVQRVGDFEASFVPSAADFTRLDARFRLPAAVWDKLPAYRDYGFAVFKLHRLRGLWTRLLGRTQSVHPMAFHFPRRDPTQLFFPTLHIHDGVVHSTARFDHALFLQGDDGLQLDAGWMRSPQAASAFMKPDRTAGIVDGAGPCYRRVVMGVQPNADIVVPAAAPRGAASVAL